MSSWTQVQPADDVPLDVKDDALSTPIDADAIPGVMRAMAAAADAAARYPRVFMWAPDVVGPRWTEGTPGAPGVTTTVRGITRPAKACGGP